MHFPLLTKAPQLLYARYARPPADARRAPLPPGHPISGHLEPAKNRPLEFLPWIARQFGDVVRLHFGPLTAHFIAAPKHVQHVVLDAHRDFTKQVRGYDKMRAVLGNGLLNSEGDFWLRQRRLIQPVFDRRSLARLADTMVRVTAEAAVDWNRLAKTGEPVDLSAEMNRLTLRIVGFTILGADVTEEASGVAQALPEIMHEINARIFSVFDFVESLPTKRNQRFKENTGKLDRMVYRIIGARRDHRGEADDLVTLLLRARDDETGAGMDDLQLRDEVLTFFLAGHETTGNALAWTWHLLGRNPGARERLEQEIDTVLAGRAPRADDVARLDYTQRVIQESMRLYPPAWFIERMCKRDTTLGGFFLPRGSVVMFAPWVTHRHPAHWEDPERFDPDRFLPERAKTRHRFAYFPFGGGPRTCIGNHFAMLEATLVLATLASRYRAEPIPGREPVPDPTITLRPRDGLWMRLVSRSLT